MKDKTITSLLKKQTAMSIDNQLTVPMTYLDVRLKEEEKSRIAVDEKLAYLERNVGASLNVLQEKVLALMGHQVI